MSIITKIGEQKNRQSIYVDDVFVCYLQSFTIFKHKLCVGQEIDRQMLARIQFESEKDYAFDLAIKHISKYTKTEKGLKDFLLSKGFLPELCDDILEKVKDYGYISDKHYAENFVETNKHRFGKLRLKQTLISKGVSKKVLEELEFETNPEDLLCMAQKYLKNKEKTPQSKQKCAKFLLARGFSWEEVSKTLEKLNFKESEDENWQ